MSNSETRTGRPAAYVLDSYGWCLRRVPPTILAGGQEICHPALRSAVFVVHGMGEQQWTETAASLRSGFEDAFELIHNWQLEHVSAEDVTEGVAPPPFTFEGYWADYSNLQETFPEDWQLFNDRERRFFQQLWHRRSYSAVKTYLWLIGQQIRLINPLRIPRIQLAVWLLYWPLQIIFPAALTVALFRAPKIITRILADVRLYASPRGIAEDAIVQRIDYRVGREFLRLIGLDWDFRQLPKEQQINASQKPFVFDRVVWVAHSLGTVISYNVLSDLFSRAAALEKEGDDEQREGVRKLRKSLRRFVTLGSPLNKFAALFPDALRPWYTHDRASLLVGGDMTDDGSAHPPHEKPRDSREWWINFYHVLDPVSGALYNPLICGKTPPVNIHTDWKTAALLPGLAHSSYWSAHRVLRFILGRTYGRTYLRDQDIERQSITQQMWFGVAGYTVWAVLLFGGLVGLIVFRVEIALAIWEVMKFAGKKAIGM